MSDRHSKWTPMDVENTVIRDGRPPWRIEFTGGHGGTIAFENYRPVDFERMVEDYGSPKWFTDSSWKPPLELPTEPTWGIAIVHTHKIAYAGKWTTKRDDDKTWFIDVLPGGITTGAAGVTAFIPLTPEQVARIEAAR